jgi:hypothetical protein
MNKLEEIKDRLNNIERLTDEELDKLSWDMLRQAASEYRNSLKEFFTKKETKNKIIEYITKYCKNNYVLRNLLSIMGLTGIHWKDYDDRYYQYIFENINNNDNSIKRQIKKYLPRFPQFENYTNKWEYIMSIPKIPPKKESIEYSFYPYIKTNISNLPEKYKKDVIKVFEDFINKNKLHEKTRPYYEDIINKLQEK